MPYLKINDLKIYYLDNKLGTTPILFIHGWLGNCLEWIYQFCYFNSKIHIVLIDLPGFGKSDKPKINYSIDFFVNLIVDFLNLNNYNQVILVGHSLGGMIAQSITTQHPKLVKKLILISTTGSAPQSMRDKLNLLFVRMIFKMGYKRFLKNILKRILSTKEESREFYKLYNNALSLPKSVVLNSFKNMTSKFRTSKNIVGISQPTLILYGNEDKIISTSMITKLGDLIPQSEVVIIKESSHRVMIEKHLKVNKKIESFISS